MVNIVKAPKHCINLHGSFFVFFSSLWKQISSKNSVLVVSEISRLFLNIFTPDDNYSLSVKASVWCNHFKWNYLKIKKYVIKFFLHFQDWHKISNTLTKKMSLRGYLFLKLHTAKSGVSLMPKRIRVRKLTDSEHVKGSETLHNTARQYFCQIFWLLWKGIEKLCFSRAWNLEALC